jgi:hypothetical protein
MLPGYPPRSVSLTSWAAIAAGTRSASPSLPVVSSATEELVEQALSVDLEISGDVREDRAQRSDLECCVAYRVSAAASSVPERSRGSLKPR